MKLSSIRKIGIAGASTLVLGLLFYALFPNMLNRQIGARVSLEKGKLRRFIWDKPPFFLTAKFYVFNVTNPDAVMKGAKPALREIGPFAYDMVHENTNQLDNETDDTITFDQRHTYFFNSAKSEGLTGEEELVVPNIFVLSSMNFVLRIMPNAISILSKAVDSIFGNPESLFVRVKARDLLFDGLAINCNATDFAGSTVCREVQASYKDFNMAKVGDTEYLFSIWGSENGSDSSDRMRVARGVRRIEDVGKVVGLNGRANMSVWGVSQCDKIEGTDGSIFHPFFDEDGAEPLDVFVPSMCRSLRYRFHSKTQFYGLDALRYTTDVGVDGEHVREHKCFCEDPFKCMRKGVLDMFKCLKVPIIASNPHFHLADPYYLDSVSGLEPKEDKHAMYVDIDPLTGTPVVFSAKVQFNMMLARQDKFRLTSNVTDTLLPLFWLEEGFETPDFLMEDLIMAHRVLSLATSFKYLTIIFGFVLSVGSMYLYLTTSTGGSDLVSKKEVRSANSNPPSGGNKKSPITMSTLQQPRT
ncbi:sensory neuron membrane protein 1-like [Copidosoma floridanum]|uniref:sensory neuron membrane protein 1-like n=1 Tax=Copidosoma floridanum TaxID=29053 RepID=UPI0006C96F5A|nr:sensory neuron membrane protein 1-like [Copidosoma floridanum]